MKNMSQQLHNRNIWCHVLCAGNIKFSNFSRGQNYIFIPTQFHWTTVNGTFSNSQLYLSLYLFTILVLYVEILRRQLNWNVNNSKRRDFCTIFVLPPTLVDEGNNLQFHIKKKDWNINQLCSGRYKDIQVYSQSKYVWRNKKIRSLNNVTNAVICKY